MYHKGLKVQDVYNLVQNIEALTNKHSVATSNDMFIDNVKNNLSLFHIRKLFSLESQSC